MKAQPGAVLFKAGLLIACCGHSARSAEISMQPVRTSGQHTIVGTEIFIPSGAQRVFLEVKISDFAPRPLKTYQATLNSAGYATGTAGFLAAAIEPCPSQNLAGTNYCRTAFAESGIGASRCIDRDPSAGFLLQCEPAYINRSRTDWVFAGTPVLDPCAVCLESPNHRWGATTGAEVAIDDGSNYYAGSLVLDVPADAVGTFTIGFISGQGITFLADQNGSEIGPLTLTPARITILCSNDTQCDDQDECTIDLCNEGTQECYSQLVDLARCDDDNECTLDECTPSGCARFFIDGCGDIPAVSDWGLAVIALSLLIAGKLSSRTAR